MAIVNIVTGVTNVCLSYPLSKFFGVVGACVSIGIAYMLRAIVLLIIYHKVLPLNIGLFIKQCYLKMSIPVFFAVGFGVCLNLAFDTFGWLMLIVKGVFVVVVYGISAFVVGLNKDEKSKFISTIKTRIKI